MSRSAKHSFLNWRVEIGAAEIPIVGIGVLVIVIALAYYLGGLRLKAQGLTTPPNELVTNGSFETDANADQVPDGWTWNGWKILHNDGEQCGGGAYDGNCAFVIRGRKDPQTLVQTIKLTGNAGDVLSFRVASKPHQILSPYSPLLTIHYTGGVTNTYAILFAPGTSDTYQVASTSFTAGTAYDQLDILLPMYQSRGEVTYDAVSLTKTP